MESAAIIVVSVCLFVVAYALWNCRDDMNDE
jgi:hypothetical protein